MLDGIVRYRLGDNAELMGAWASVHSVVARCGRTRSRSWDVGETPKAV